MFVFCDMTPRKLHVIAYRTGFWQVRKLVLVVNCGMLFQRNFQREVRIKIILNNIKISHYVISLPTLEGEN